MLPDALMDSLARLKLKGVLAPEAGHIAMSFREEYTSQCLQRKVIA